MRIELKYGENGYADCYAPTLCGRKVSSDMYMPVQEGQTSEDVEDSLIKNTSLTLDDVCVTCLARLDEDTNAKTQVPPTL
jgi:hypothetical protein